MILNSFHALSYPSVIGWSVDMAAFVTAATGASTAAPTAAATAAPNAAAGFDDFSGNRR